MGSISQEVYCTLLTNDSYLPGVLTVAQALRDGGTAYKIAVIVTSTTVAEATMEALKKSFDHILDVQTITNSDLTQLKIMNRSDLASTFTKFSLWSQTQFSKIIYLDADTLPLRAPDELFNLPTNFAASPELGFPDCFNSGVMVLTPSLQTFEALKQEAIRDGSFDGGDQGLLNTHFPDFHRLSFMYNMEMYPTYRLYMPAVLKERSHISAVHFIGKGKPWAMDKNAPPVDGTAFSSFYKEMLGKWWEVYGRVEKAET